MYRLFSHTKITGSFHTTAKFSASWKAPMLVVPSPKKHTADVVVAAVLGAPGGAAGDRQVRADDRIGAHHAVLAPR